MIYLYLKTHNKTGLKYLGKTEKDPFVYQGSGSYWKKHIKIHGKDITTEILFQTDDPELFKKTAIAISEELDIVKSSMFANLRIEEGDGGDTSKTDGFIQSLKQRRINDKKKKWWNNGVDQTHREFPPDNTYILGRLPFNNIGSKIGSETQRGKIWVNNGKDEMMVYADQIPEGFILGRLLSKKKGKPNTKASGSRWWNNGVISRMSKECPGTDYSLGRLKSL